MNKRARLTRRILRDHHRVGQHFMARLTCHMELVEKSDWHEEWATWSCPRCQHKHERRPRAYS